MGQRLVHTLPFILFCLISLISCTNDVEKKLKLFMQEPVTLPDSLEFIKGDTSAVESLIIEKPTLIVYIDSLSCTSCKIGHLIDYYMLYEAEEVMKKIDIKIIFSPKQEDYNKVKMELSLSLCKFPLYINHSGELKDKNCIIVKDQRFHCFLIDEKCIPIFVGDPTKSDDFWQLFEKIVLQL